MNPKLKPLRALLRKRETTLKQICASVPVSYTNFSAVLAGRRPGTCTWPKLRQYFTDEERAVIVAEFGAEATGYAEVFGSAGCQVPGAE